MASYILLTINFGNGELNHAGIKERVKASLLIIKEVSPDIVFVQNIPEGKTLSQLKLDDEYNASELPYNREINLHTGVLWKKETVSLWTPSKKTAQKYEKKCEKNIVEDRFSSINISGPKGEVISLASYNAFHYKPKDCGTGCFTDGEKRKLTKDLLNFLKNRKVSTSIIIGGSFALSASNTPRESIFHKAQSSETKQDFFMFANKSPERVQCHISDVREYPGNISALKYVPVVATLQIS